MNISFIIGNLGSDAEVKESNGSKFITLSIADTRRIKQSDGRYVESVNWIDAVISNPDHPVLPYLKQGVKVAIIGQSSLRVYSSKKDRCMKAGQTIHVLNIELCGGSSDEVPRQLIDPETGRLIDVQKMYVACQDGQRIYSDNEETFVDKYGQIYVMGDHGVITPVRQDDTMIDKSEDGSQLIDVI